MRVRVTIVAVKKQGELYILSVCICILVLVIRRASRIVLASYYSYIVICDLSGYTTYFHMIS